MTISQDIPSSKTSHWDGRRIFEADPRRGIKTGFTSVSRICYTQPVESTISACWLSRSTPHGLLMFIVFSFQGNKSIANGIMSFILSPMSFSHWETYVQQTCSSQALANPILILQSIHLAMENHHISTHKNHLLERLSRSVDRSLILEFFRWTDGRWWWSTAAVAAPPTVDPATRRVRDAKYQQSRRTLPFIGN